MAAGAQIEIKDVSISLSAQDIVSNIRLKISAGEFVGILGPSGCGKTTLLNGIAGFLPYRGQILVDGARVDGPAVSRGVVFQNSDVLFPWLTARENVEYGPATRGISRSVRAGAAHKFLELVGLGHVMEKFPSQLSGGMRQRLQLARVLVNEPSVVLMDEPFGALDAQTREVMQLELVRISEASGATIVFVTHDIQEAILLSDRIVTMTTGPAATLKSIHSVNLPFPRDSADPAILPMYRLLRAEIGEEVKKVLRQQGLSGGAP